MQHNDSLPASSPGHDWHVLGELDLPVGTGAGEAIDVWLADILVPLDLHVDFLDKILKSAQTATVRAMQPETVVKCERIHLMISVPQDRSSKGRTWGFFWLEKIQNAAEGMTTSAHAVEFYLYLEGDDAALPGWMSKSKELPHPKRLPVCSKLNGKRQGEGGTLALADQNHTT